MVGSLFVPQGKKRHWGCENSLHELGAFLCAFGLKKKFIHDHDMPSMFFKTNLSKLISELWRRTLHWCGCRRWSSGTCPASTRSPRASRSPTTRYWGRRSAATGSIQPAARRVQSSNLHFQISGSCFDWTGNSATRRQKHVQSKQQAVIRRSLDPLTIY